MKLNEGAKFWFYDVGVDVIPSDTRSKRPIVDWQKYQDNPMSVDEFENFIKEEKFEKGLAIIPGKIPRGKNKGKYLIAIDIDKEKGLNEFCNSINIENVKTLDDLSKITIVEQHQDDLTKAHTYFISPIPFPAKDSNTKIGIEVKGDGKNGLMYVSPSIHKNGSPYQITGTKDILELGYDQARKLITHINSICNKYGIKYLEKESNTRISPKIREMIEKLEIDKSIAILEGERHDTLLPIANSILIRQYKSDISLDERKDFFEKINNQLCQPYPLPTNEIDAIWKSAIKFLEINKEQNKINQLKRVKNIQKNPNISFLIDTYDDKDWNNLSYLMIQGKARIINMVNDKDTIKQAHSLLSDKYLQYKNTIVGMGDKCIVIDIQKDITWKY